MKPDEDGYIDIPPYGMFKVAEAVETPAGSDYEPGHWQRHLFNPDGTVK
jgi:hypothetical protein